MPLTCHHNTPGGTFSLFSKCCKGNLPKLNFDYSVKVETNAIKTNKLKATLENSIKQTMMDDQSRGTFVVAQYYPESDDGSVMTHEEKRRHAFSFTAKRKDSEIQCNSMDPNTFFATGKGFSGCKAVSDKIEAMVQQYLPTEIFVSHIKQKK